MGSTEGLNANRGGPKLTGHLSIEILGVLKGAADGPLAISTLALIALAATACLRLRR
jgi:hypothetical protein